MSRNRIRAVLSFLLCSLVLMCASGSVMAGGVEPVQGGWKGKTAQGFFIYFGVREGPVLTNVRLTFREVVCGEASVHQRSVVLSVDESGHFLGTIIPNHVELEGSFTAPRRVQGRIVSLETSGLPGCTRKVVGFSAHPKG